MPASETPHMTESNSPKSIAVIKLRRANPTDGDAVAEFAAAIDSVHNTLQMPFANAVLWRDRFADAKPGALTLVAEIEGKVIGVAGLQPLNDSLRQSHVRALGITVAKAAQGRGVGTALLQGLLDWADQWAQVKRIELRVNVDNLSAIALYKKLGFLVEGRLVGECFRAGQYVDVFAMARWFGGRD
jgi:L-phenylalanine/L-methionine N-acetyltransferase